VARSEKTFDEFPAETERAWYYAEGDTEIGPVTIQQLKRKIASTHDLEELFVWCEGMAQWKMVNEIPELSRDEAKVAIGTSSNTSMIKTTNIVIRLSFFHLCSF
jgi:hypothetical protein